MGAGVRATVALVFAVVTAVAPAARANPSPSRCEAVAGQLCGCSGLVLPVSEVKRALQCRVDLRACANQAETQAAMHRVHLQRCTEELEAERGLVRQLDAALAEKLTAPPMPNDTAWHVAVAVLGAAVVGLSVGLAVALETRAR